MVHLWRKTKEETETSKVAPGVGSTGDIAVIVDGKKLDNELVRLACMMAKRAKRKVHNTGQTECQRHPQRDDAVERTDNDAVKQLS